MKKARAKDIPIDLLIETLRKEHNYNEAQIEFLKKTHEEAVSGPFSSPLQKVFEVPDQALEDFYQFVKDTMLTSGIKDQVLTQIFSGNQAEAEAAFKEYVQKSYLILTSQGKFKHVLNLLLQLDNMIDLFFSVKAERDLDKITELGDPSKHSKTKN